jgi:hypothetical protein
MLALCLLQVTARVKLRRTVVREEAGLKTNRKDTERLTDRLIGLKALLNWCVPTDPEVLYRSDCGVGQGATGPGRQCLRYCQATAILPDNLNDVDVGCLVKDWRQAFCSVTAAYLSNPGEPPNRPCSSQDQLDVRERRQLGVTSHAKSCRARFMPE